MAAGKNKLLKGARLYVGGYDLSSDALDVGSLANTFGEVKLTGWSDTAHNYLADGHRELGIRGVRSYIDDATGMSCTSIKAVPAVTAITLAIGSAGETPTTGDVAYILPPLQVSDMASFDAGAGLFAADFVYDSTQYDNDFNSPWGKVLRNGLVTQTINTASVDFGAAGASYGATCHVYYTDSGNYSFKIEHSATDAWAGEQATLLTFSMNGSAVASEFQAATTTVQRYCRLVCTRTAGELRVCSALALTS